MKYFKLALISVLTISVISFYYASARGVIKFTSKGATFITQETMKSSSIPITELVTQKSAINSKIPMAITVTSLADSYPDGAINIDDNGDVTVDKDLHRLFDYYLSAVGEMSIEQIKKQLLSQTSLYLSLDQLEQLRDYFDQYLNYLSQSEKLALSFNDNEPLDQRLMAIKNLQENLLGNEMSKAFFQDDHDYVDWVLSAHQSDQEQLTNKQIKWLEQENRATEYQDVVIQNHNFNDFSVSEEVRFEVRSETYGEEVAVRLAELDQDQLSWQHKVNEYIRLREESADEAALVQLEQSYQPIELKRLQAYWRSYISEI